MFRYWITSVLESAEVKTILMYSFSYHESDNQIVSPITLGLFFWPHCEACGILVPRPGIEPGPQQ